MGREQRIATADAVEIASITSQNRAVALRVLEGHVKAVSLIWLKVIGLPALDGIIVRQWSRQASQILTRFCKRHDFSEVLLRIDKKAQRWTQERGGFVVDLKRLPKMVRELKERGFISILLEPASPYDDVYSFGAVCDPQHDHLTIEVVGPGFDASDILRSDVQPHERFEMRWLPLVSGGDAPSLISLRRTYLTDSGSYIESVKHRLAKIAARIDGPEFLVPSTASSDSVPEKRQAEAIRFLEVGGHHLLLDHLKDYQPVPRRYLNLFVRGIVELMTGLDIAGIRLGTTSVSAGLVTQQRLVFWDFFPADLTESKKLFQ
jgi:hypothetical protein